MASRFKFARNFSVTWQQAGNLQTGTEMLNPCIVRPIKTQIHFNQIKLKMAANNISNIHRCPDVLSTLMLLQQGKFCMASREAVVQRYSVKKLLLKLKQNSQESTCVGVSF